MRSILLLFAMACSTTGAASDATSHAGHLDGGIGCGSQSCLSGQLCVTVTAGLTCNTNDAGVGSFDVLAQYCQDVPSTCNGDPTCDCLGQGCGTGQFSGACLGVEARQVSCGCF